MIDRIRILILEDNRADARLMSLVLDEYGLAHEWRQASNESEFVEALDWSPAIVLADHAVPTFGAVPALRLIAERRPDLPLIVVSGNVGEESAAEAIRLGAEDYVHKDRIARLGPTVRRTLERSLERRGREAERAERLRLAELGAEVSKALIGSGPAAEMLQRCAEAFVRHLDVAFARIWTADETGQTLLLQASAGLYTHRDGAHARVPVGRWKIGRIAAERRPHLTNDVRSDPRISDPEWARRERMVAFAGHPLEVDGRLLGVIGMFSRHALNEPTMSAIATVSREIALGVERKRIEAELDLRRRDLESLFRTSPSALSINRASDGTYLEVNDEFLRALGYLREEVVGKTPWDLRIWIGRQAFRSLRQQLAEQGVVTNYETDLRTKSGESISVIISAARMTFGGEPVFVSFARDVGDLKRTARDLREALERAKESDRLKTTFLETMSHEFRTPLNVILGYNSLIAARLADAGDRDAQDLVDAVSRASKRLLRSLHAVLDLSRFATGTFAVHRSVVDVATVARQAVEAAAPAAEEKGLAIALRVETDRTSTVHDEGCVAKAIEHLVDNAVKFTRAGAVDVSIHRDEEDRLILRVGDTGIGIDPDYLGALFEPFTQESSGRTRAFEGLGVGLALVRHSLAAAGATIGVASEKGHGTTFTVRFAEDSPVLTSSGSA